MTRIYLRTGLKYEDLDFSRGAKDFAWVTIKFNWFLCKAPYSYSPPPPPRGLFIGSKLFYSSPFMLCWRLLIPASVLSENHVIPQNPPIGPCHKWWLFSGAIMTDIMTWFGRTPSGIILGEISTYPREMIFLSLEMNIIICRWPIQL